MSKNISISRLREARNVSGVDKIITNNPSDDSETSGTTTWVPEGEAYNYVNADTLDVSENGTYPKEGEDNGYFNVVKVDIDGGASSGDSAELIDEKVIKENGTVYAIDDAKNEDSKTAAYEEVKVQVPLVAKVITANGQYDATDDTSAEGDTVQGYSSVEVKVPIAGESTENRLNKVIKANGLYKAEEEPVGEDETPFVGYSQVDVAIPMVKKKVVKNGTFNASDEKDENDDEAVAYSEVEVGVQILQPSFDFVMAIDRKKKSVQMPFSISIGNTAEADYTDYEKRNRPSVNFNNADIRLFASGGGWSPFRVQNLNFGSGFCRSWPRTITVNGKEIKINSYNEAWNYTRLNNWDGGVSGELKNGIDKYIFRGQFTDSGRGFVIAGNYAYQGYQCWIVPNVSYSKGQYYSFTIKVKTASA